MNDNDRIDEIIRSAASDYNRPPATPGDEMWNEIVAARERSAPRLHLATGGVVRSDFPSRTFTSVRGWVGMAAAAVLLLATGVGIGRLTNRGVQPATTAVAANGDREATPPVTVETIVPQANVATVQGQASKPRTREEILENPQIVGSRPLTRLLTSSDYRSSSVFPLAAPAVTTTYQVATQRHLAAAEALLTSFSVGSRDERMDAQFAVWARGLLSNTRLLLDSPAGDDPRRAQLLQDLELVLAQIVQLSPNAAAQDRELIQGSIQNEHVMTRLRSAIPAGQPREITER